MAIVRYTREEIANMQSQTDWDRVMAMPDEDIVIDDDCPDIAQGIRSGRVKLRGRPKLDDKKVPISIRLDADTLKSLRGLGQGWQTKLSDKIADWVRSDPSGFAHK